MNASLDRVILYVNDVDRLRDFYVETFGLEVTEEINAEWVVLKAGAGEIGLHRAGAAYRTGSRPENPAPTNVKLVFTVHGDLESLRSRLIERGIAMGEIKSYGTTGPLCDGTDPEGNVFQLSLAARV